MQSIIELLYKGDIRGVNLKLPADRRDKELSYYDKIYSFYSLPFKSNSVCTNIMLYNVKLLFCPFAAEMTATHFRLFPHIITP